MHCCISCAISLTTASFTSLVKLATIHTQIYQNGKRFTLYEGVVITNPT